MQLTIDVGKSGTRVRGDHPDDATSGPGADPSLVGRADGADYVSKIIDRAAAGSVSEMITSVAIGSTAIPDRPDLVLARLRHRWPAARLMLFEDLVLSHAAALGAPGVVASVGTGVGIAALGTDGRLIRVDGWGPDLGDRGSAWQIGRDGLRAAYAAEDGTGPPTGLRQAGRAHLGGLDLAVATRLLSAPDRITTICAFARQVSAAADPRVDPGVDPVADAILDDAAADLISSVLAAARRSGTTAVVFRGGLLDSPGYRSKINRAAIAAGLEVREAQRDVLAVEHDRLLLPPYRENAVALVIP